MQIKTITCHDVYNYGASLQAYALQTYLESLGHDVSIIDYKPDYLSNHYKLWSVSNSVYDKPIIKQAYLMAKLPGRLLALKRKRVFDHFTRHYLKLTERYHSNEELKHNPPKADVYIAGSDQIWNTFFQNGRDAAFYLDFAPKQAKKVAYAASFATKDVSEEYRPFVTRMLQNFDAISIREAISLPLLKSLGYDDGFAVCDPVFLLTREQWNVILPEERISENYLLVYDTEGSETLRIIACEIAQKKGLKIYNVSASPFDYADKNYWASSPVDFLKLIRDAGYIISNSFHACAFSMIYEKNFCVVNRTEGINERMKSLLADYEIEDRLTCEFTPMLLETINYERVNIKKLTSIKCSKDYLCKVIQ